MRGEWDRPKLIQWACAQQAAVREDGRPFWAGGRAGGHLWPLDLPPVMSSAWCLPSRPLLQSELITALPPRAVWRMRHKYGACLEHSLNLGCGDAKPPRDIEISWQSHCSHPSRPQTSWGTPAPPTERRQGLWPRAPHAPHGSVTLFPGSTLIWSTLPLPRSHPTRSTSPRTISGQTVSKDSGQISSDLQLATKSPAWVLGPKGCGRGQNTFLTATMCSTLRDFAFLEGHLVSQWMDERQICNLCHACDKILQHS